MIGLFEKWITNIDHPKLLVPTKMHNHSVKWSKSVQMKKVLQTLCVQSEIIVLCAHAVCQIIWLNFNWRGSTLNRDVSISVLFIPPIDCCTIRLNYDRIWIDRLVCACCCHYIVASTNMDVICVLLYFLIWRYLIPPQILYMYNKL